MSRAEKLLRRLRSRPKDFTWDELVTVLSGLGFEMFRGSGSARKFIHPDRQVLILHEPHPQKTLKRWAVDYVLREISKRHG